jgi:hypothetical protein
MTWLLETLISGHRSGVRPGLKKLPNLENAENVFDLEKPSRTLLDEAGSANATG